MSCTIRNPYATPVTLPHPLRGVLKPGQGITVSMTAAAIFNIVGGEALMGGLKVTDIDTLGPYDDEYLGDRYASNITDMYVSDINGDDDNDGLSPNTPIKTLAEALNKCPTALNNSLKIHFGQHSGAGYEWPLDGLPEFHRVNASLYFLGDGAGQPGEDDPYTEILASTAAGASSGIAVVKGSGMTVDAYRTKFIEILSGAAAGDIRVVSWNDATDIVPLSAFSAAVAPGDLYRIIEPTVEFSIPTVNTTDPPTEICRGFSPSAPTPAQNANNILMPAPRVYFVGMKWTAKTGAFGQWSELFFSHSSVCFVGVIMTGITTNCDINSALLAGIDYAAYANYLGEKAGLFGPYQDGLIAHTTQWRGWGLVLLDGTGSVVSTPQACMNLIGYVAMLTAERIAFATDGVIGLWQLMGASAKTTYSGSSACFALQVRRSTVEFKSVVADDPPSDIVATANAGANSAGIYVNAGGRLMIKKVNISMNAGSGIVAEAEQSGQGSFPSHVSIEQDLNITAPRHLLCATMGSRIGGGIVAQVTGSGPGAGQETAIINDGRYLSGAAATSAQDLSAYVNPGDALVGSDGTVIQTL